MNKIIDLIRKITDIHRVFQITIQPLVEAILGFKPDVIELIQDSITINGIHYFEVHIGSMDCGEFPLRIPYGYLDNLDQVIEYFKNNKIYPKSYSDNWWKQESLLPVSDLDDFHQTNFEN